MSLSRKLVSPTTRALAKGYATAASSKQMINLVEVGPRDGLQNEKQAISVSTKAELINRLAHAGVKTIEAGSFVSPKWVPQMAGTSEVLSSMQRHSGVNYPVLVPNKKGLENLLSLLSTHKDKPALTEEIAVFTAATDAFAKANLNTTVSHSLANLGPVIREALDAGLRVRGYLSVVIECPYSGRVDARVVRDVARELSEMGCYEVSLGETVGKGTPDQVAEMIEEVKKGVPVGQLAGHFHDTFGTAVANVLTALEHGIRTIDSSVGGLGGCPYSPGATGNVATEDVLYALKHSSKYHVAGNNEGTIDLEQMADIGWWINQQLGRETASRADRKSVV